MQMKSSRIYLVAFSALICVAVADVAMAQPGGGRQRGGFGGPGGGFGGGFGRQPGSGADMASLLQSEDVREELDLTDSQRISIDAAIEAYNDERNAGREQAGGFDFQAFQQASEEEQARLREQMQKQREESQKKQEELSKKTDEVVVAFLEADQVTRLKELRVQSMGIEALRNEEIKKALKLTEEQNAKIGAAFASMEEKRAEMFNEMRAAFGGGRGGQGRPGGEGGRPQRPGGADGEEGGARPQPGGNEGGQAGRRPGGQGGPGAGFEDMRAKMEELSKEAETTAMAVLTAGQTEQFAAMKGKKFEGEFRAPRRGGFGGPGQGGGRGPGGQGGRPQRPGSEDNSAI